MLGQMGLLALMLPAAMREQILVVVVVVDHITIQITKVEKVVLELLLWHIKVRKEQLVEL